MKASLDKLGLEPVIQTPEEFGKFVARRSAALGRDREGQRREGRLASLPWQGGVRPPAANRYAGGNDDHEAYPAVGRTAAAVLCVGRKRRERAVLSQPADPDHRVVPARRRHRRDRAHHRRAARRSVSARTSWSTTGPGSNGNISAELAANARPDGHTLLLGSDSLFGINPHLYSRMPVDLRKAFVPVTNLVTNLLILTVNPDKVPSKTLAGIRRASPARPIRRCSMRRSATAASITSRWSC